MAPHILALLPTLSEALHVIVGKVTSATLTVAEHVLLAWPSLTVRVMVVVPGP